MVSVTQQTIATGTSLGHVTRPARALIGWMKQQEAQLMLAERNMQNANKQSHVDKANAARVAVGARAPITKQSDVLFDIDPALSGYVATFSTHPDFQPFAAEGWIVKIADLSKVIALQPMVFSDHAEERTRSATPDDMSALANITLPIQLAPESLPLQFDPTRSTWMITSRNPNLRIFGQFSAPVDAGNGQLVTGCGFLVKVMPSFVQVILHKGRYLLRDGYHRSIGLLAQGITHVPVLFREFGEFEDLGVGVGMLPEQSYLGERPPFLADYLSEIVTAEVQMPASQKMLVIQGIEMNPIG